MKTSVERAKPLAARVGTVRTVLDSCACVVPPTLPPPVILVGFGPFSRLLFLRIVFKIAEKFWSR